MAEALAASTGRELALDIGTHLTSGTGTVQPTGFLNGGLVNGRMFLQNLLDFLRSNAVCTRFDHLTAPSNDVQKALRIPPRQVTSVVTMFVQDGCCSFWIIPVSLHDVRPPGDDLPHLAGSDVLPGLVHDPHLGADDLSSAGEEAPGQLFGTLGVVVASGKHGQHRRGLGHAVPLDEVAPEGTHGLLQQLGGHGGGAVQKPPQGRDIIVPELGVVDDEVDHRRHENRGRDAVRLDRLQ